MISEPAGYNHWRCEQDAAGIVHLVLDRKGSSTNSLSREVLGELDLLLAEVERTTPVALVIRPENGAASSPELTCMNSAASAALRRRCSSSGAARGFWLASRRCRFRQSP